MSLRSILLLRLVLAGLLVGGYPITDAADGLRKPLDLPAGGAGDDDEEEDDADE